MMRRSLWNGDRQEEEHYCLESCNGQIQLDLVEGTPSDQAPQVTAPATEYAATKVMDLSWVEASISTCRGGVETTDSSLCACDAVRPLTSACFARREGWL